MNPDRWLYVLAGVGATLLAIAGLTVVSAATGMGPMAGGMMDGGMMESMGEMMEQCREMMDGHGHGEHDGDDHSHGDPDQNASSSESG